MEVQKGQGGGEYPPDQALWVHGGRVHGRMGTWVDGACVGVLGIGCIMRNGARIARCVWGDVSGLRCDQIHDVWCDVMACITKHHAPCA